MKVDKILTCVCCDHEPNGGDSVYYGMPELRVCGGKPETFFEAYCPVCGRGGLFQFKSAYLALKHWNKMQQNLRDWNKIQQNLRDFFAVTENGKHLLKRR